MAPMVPWGGEALTLCSEEQGERAPQRGREVCRKEGVLCHRRSARGEHWLLTFKTSVWWRDVSGSPAASHSSEPRLFVIDEASVGVRPMLYRACFPLSLFLSPNSSTTFFFSIFSAPRCELRYIRDWWSSKQISKVFLEIFKVCVYFFATRVWKYFK